MCIGILPGIFVRIHGGRWKELVSLVSLNFRVMRSEEYITHIDAGIQVQDPTGKMPRLHNNVMQQPTQAAGAPTMFQANTPPSHPSLQCGGVLVRASAAPRPARLQCQCQNAQRRQPVGNDSDAGRMSVVVGGTAAGTAHQETVGFIHDDSR